MGRQLREELFSTFPQIFAWRRWCGHATIPFPLDHRTRTNPFEGTVRRESLEDLDSRRGKGSIGAVTDAFPDEGPSYHQPCTRQNRIILTFPSASSRSLDRVKRIRWFTFAKNFKPPSPPSPVTFFSQRTRSGERMVTISRRGILFPRILVAWHGLARKTKAHNNPRSLP